MILGDSIAVGTANVRKECVAYAKGGINSRDWNKNYSNKDLSAKTVIISLGSNDHVGVRTIWELQQMRERVKADRVFWILPHGNLTASKVPIEHIQRIVKTMAAEYGDTVLPITRISKDNIHPSWAGYKELANQTK